LNIPKLDVQIAVKQHILPANIHKWHKMQKETISLNALK